MNIKNVIETDGSEGRGSAWQIFYRNVGLMSDLGEKMRGKKIVDEWVSEVYPVGRLYEWAQLIKKEIAPKVKEQINERISVKLECFLKENRLSKVDIDNICDKVFNALYQGPAERIIVDDSLIDNVEATKIPSTDDEKIHVQIWEWK